MMLMLMMIMTIHDDHRNDDDPYCKLGLGQPANGAHRTSHWGPATYQPDFAANIFAAEFFLTNIFQATCQPDFVETFFLATCQPDFVETFFWQHVNQILQETFLQQHDDDDY